MYKSPIEIIVQDTYQKLLEQREENIFKAILETGVKVDKEELLKALKYDREQYNKGYIDGLKEFAERVQKYDNPHYWGYEHNYVIYGTDFEKLLKEMVGEDK